MIRLAVIVLVTFSACGAAVADDWPTRPITLVVPYASGGPTDAVGRLFAQQMSETLKQEVIVENIAGAGGMTGSSRVAHAPLDGYQVLFGGGGTMTYNQTLYKKPLYNSITDFAPVGLLTEQSLVLVARKGLPGNGLQDFIRYVKTNKSASFGSGGAGSSSHLGCVMLNLAIGASATHVPYRGTAPAMQDLIGERIDYICDLIQDAAPQMRSGGVKSIAMLSRSRSAILPEVATADEQGLADFDTVGWYGLFLPRNAPAPIIQKLHGAASIALDAPSLRDRLYNLGVEIVPPERRSPEYLARFLKDDIEKWAATIKASGITAD